MKVCYKLKRIIKYNILGEISSVLYHMKYPVATEKKGVVYTCITGNYDSLKEPAIFPDNVEYVAITDSELTDYNGKWRIICIPEEIRKAFPDSVDLNRYVKLHPGQFFDSDYTMYIDGNIQVRKDIRLFYGFAKDSRIGIAIHRHYKRRDVYEEAQHLFRVGKGNSDSISKLIERYRSEGLPDNSGLLEACVILTDIKNPKAIRILDEWWQNFWESGCKRDQLILPYILWKNGYSTSDLGIMGKNVWNNTFFRSFLHLK